MLKVLGDNLPTITDYPRSKEGRITLKEIGVGEKPSIISDVFFKTMFKNGNRIKYSAKFISYFVNISYDVLKEKLKLVSEELDKEKLTNKSERCDYIAELDGVFYNIEVNNNPEAYTFERNLEYTLKQYSRKVQMNKDKKSYKYSKVLQLNLNNFYFKGYEKTIHTFTLNDGDVKYTDKLIIVEIYLPLLLKKYYNSGIEGLTELERFILATYVMDIKSSKKLGKDIDIMKEYIKDSMDVMDDKSFGESYDKEQALFDDGYDSGVVDIAKNLLKENIDISTISRVTNLSVEEITNLQKEMK